MKFKTLITVLISALFLAMAVWNFDTEEFVKALREVHPLYFLPAFTFYLLSFLFRTFRWGRMLRGVKAIAPRPLFSYLVIGYMANNLLPARLGEIVRAYVTGKQERMSRSSAFASIVIERLFDGLTIVMLLVVLILTSGLDRAWLRYMAWVSSLLFLGGLAFLFALTFQQESALALAKRAVRLLPRQAGEKILHILGRFVAGLQLLRTPRDLAVSFFSSFLVWGCEVMVYVIYLHAFEINVPLHAALLALIVVNLSSLIPSSPSYIGVFQFACIKSLEVFGVGASTALAWSVAIHATQIIPITLLGLFLLGRMGLSMRELRAVKLDERGNGASEEAGSL